MDENLSRGYIQLGKSRTASDFRFTNGFSHLSPPIDKCNCIYFALVLSGVGFLLPYNSFIIAVDYFRDRYPDTTVVFDMTLVYIVMAFFAVLANNILVETLSLNTRITFGYLVSFFTLLFVALCEIWWDVFGASASYTINLIAVAVVALGCTVQQSSFYGYTSMLPSRYTQAVMAGESAAGFLVSGNRILTKLLLDDQRVNTIIFFVMSVAIVALCFALHQVVRRTDFVQFYITLCRESHKIVLEPTEDVGLMDPLDQAESGNKNQYGVLKLQQSPLATDSATSSSDNTAGQYSAFSFSNPVYEPSATAAPPPGATATAGVGAGGTTYKVEDVVIHMRSVYTSSNTKAWGGMKRLIKYIKINQALEQMGTLRTLNNYDLLFLQGGLLARWDVAKIIWPYMLSIGLAYFVTLCLYPGIISEIVSCKFGSWMPVILMAVFNAADLVGKVLASVPYDWSRTQLIVFAWMRAILIPLLLLCATPRGSPLIPTEGYALLFSLLLGVTNGLVGSIPMIQAPSKVPEEHRELTGNIMTLSYNVGLTAGSLVAYLNDYLLGAEHSTCKTSESHILTTLLPFTSATASAASSISNIGSVATAAPDLISTVVNVVTQNATTVATVASTVLAAVAQSTIGISTLDPSQSAVTDVNNISNLIGNATNA